MAILLNHFIRTYDEALPAAKCSELIEKFEHFSSFQQANGAGIRPGLERSGWTELDVGRIADHAFRQCISDQIIDYYTRYNQEIGLSLRISPPRKHAEIIMKRYRAGTNESFQLHFDALGPVANRYLVFLWYLNNVPSGGTTDFPDLKVSIAPKQGRLLMFPPYWLFQHMGTPAVGGDKYILSTYLAY